MDHAQSIVKHSPASKSLFEDSSRQYYWAHQRGLDSEKKVQEYYQARGFKLLKHRLKTPFAEVDLLLQSKNGDVVLVEVKSANVEDFQIFRITPKQKKRLERALIFLSEYLDCPVGLNWAFVNKFGEVTVVENVYG